MKMKVTSNPLVYVLDDDPIFNKLVIHVLKKYGVKVEAFRAQEELFARVQQKAPLMCIIDLNLTSALKGWDLIQLLRESTKAALPILIVSTEMDASVVAHAIERGADDYLFKPLDRDLLTAKLMRFFTTDQLDFSKFGGGSLSKETRIDTTVLMDARIREIDEGGITLWSDQLINKGTALKIEGELLQQATGNDKPLLVTVMSATLDAKTGTYSLYLEFDPLDLKLNQSVRAWITRGTPEQTA